MNLSLCCAKNFELQCCLSAALSSIIGVFHVKLNVFTCFLHCAKLRVVPNGFANCSEFREILKLGNEFLKLVPPTGSFLSVQTITCFQRRCGQQTVHPFYLTYFTQVFYCIHTFPLYCTALRSRKRCHACLGFHRKFQISLRWHGPPATQPLPRYRDVKFNFPTS